MLHVVATPIGNLEDITIRAIEVLKSVDFIACEDTRHTRILLDRYEIKKPLISYHQHSRFTRIDYIISELKSGKNVALVTDAGTPGISDPGQRLISEAVTHKIEVVPIPGPSAVIAALSISGFPTDEFLFLGYLPKKKGRQTLLKDLTTKEQRNRTIVIYESPERILKTLKDLESFLGDQKVVVCRELTKKFEEVYRGKISEVLDKVRPQGEFAIVIKRSDVSYQHGETTNTHGTTKNRVGFLFPELSYKIKEIAKKIRDDYGSGQKETIYQRAFAEELEIKSIPFKKEINIKIYSPNSKKVIGSYRPDFLIDNRIIIEIKSVKFLPKNQENQLFDYLKNSDYELGYIVNFGGNKLYLRRIIYTKDFKDFSGHRVN